MTVIIVLAVLGILLVLAELVLPGGIIGLGGVVCLVAAVVLTFVNFNATAGFVAIGLLIIFGFLTLGIWMRYFHRLPLTRNLVLNKSIDERSQEQDNQSWIGREGLTLTKIAPSGHMDVDGERIDVMSESGVIEKGVNVRIVDARGPSIYVEKA